MGTRTEAIIMRVIDGDTLLCKVAGKTETVRAIGCDTEEAHPELKSKPVTNAGVLGAEFGKQFWWNWQPVLEFESDSDIETCLQTQRDYFGRLRCYLWREDENYNERLIKEGLTPYFRKYGSSLYYNQKFMSAMEQAQFNHAGIWNRDIDDPELAPNYIRLLPWWNLRGSIVDWYRVYGAKIAYDATGLCDNLCRQISRVLASSKKENNDMFTFIDLQGGTHGKYKHGHLYKSGTKKSHINLWIEEEELINKVENNYTHRGRGYCYCRGIPEVRFGVHQLRVLEICDRPDQFTNITIDQLPSVARREAALQEVRYAVRRRLNASSL